MRKLRDWLHSTKPPDYDRMLVVLTVIQVLLDVRASSGR
jgi:hypothetical protein